MSGIAGIIHWNGEPVECSNLDLMVGLMEHRGPDGIELEVSGPAGMAHAKMALRHNELNWRPQPMWLPNRSKAIVADARLYNRDDLLARLGEVEWFRGPASDAEIILALFERFGEETPDLLDGDFAFVIWDAEARRVFAARDPFGVKPLVFWAQGERFVFASEPKQILALPYVPVVPDDLAVGEVLVNQYRDSSRTFYKDVRLVRPAHSLTASRDGWRETRHWNPDPEKAAVFSTPDECFELFRFHLKNAVTRRLQIDYPAMAELSGGYDSSSVVVMAAAAEREGTIGCPRIETLSALYPGFSCDEREYSEAISEVVPFRRRTYLASQTARSQCVGIGEELRRMDSPLAAFPNGESLTFGGQLKEASARVLLTGLAGDEVTRDESIREDLASEGRYLALARLLWWSHQIWPRPLRTYPRRVARLVAPGWLRRTLRVARRTEVWRAPDWMRPEFAARLEEYFASYAEQAPLYRSAVQQTVYVGVSSPRTHLVLELFERGKAYLGVEACHPFLDRRLVEFILAIRFMDRIPKSGLPKYLLRRSLAADLPSRIRERSTKANFAGFHRNAFQHLEEEMSDDGSWLPDRYVSKSDARNLVERAKGDVRLRVDTASVQRVQHWLGYLNETKAPFREQPAYP